MQINFIKSDLEAYFRSNSNLSDSDIDIIVSGQNSIFDQCDEYDENNNKVLNGDNKLTGYEISKFISLVKSSYNNLKDVMFGFIQKTMTSQCSEPQSVNPTQEVTPNELLKEKIDEAKKVLVDNWDKIDLSAYGVPAEKMERLKTFIKNIHYNDVPFGSMQSIDDGIWVNTNPLAANFYDISVGEICKILIHEAVHCDARINPDKLRAENGKYSSDPDTHIGEEYSCESIALLASAQLVQMRDEKGNPLIEDFSPYNGHNVSEYLTDQGLLDKDVNYWLDRGYMNFPKNKSGEMVISQKPNPMLNGFSEDEIIRVYSGSKITINGTTYTIGEDCMLIGTGNREGILPVFSLQKNDGSIIAGNLVFDKVVPTEQDFNTLPYKYQENQDNSPVFTLESNGEIYYGKMYNLKR